MIRHFVILGASGDLTGRYLMLALHLLLDAGKLPEGFRILGIAREKWSTTFFRRHISERLDRHTGGLAPASRNAFVSSLEYRSDDVTDRDQAARALGQIDEPIVAYLALPPSIFTPTIKVLAVAELPKWSRIVVEKPFGENLQSARTLNRLLHEAFHEEAVFRLDPFPGKQTIQNILGLHFADRVFEPIWSQEHVERVDVI